MKQGNKKGTWGKEKKKKNIKGKMRILMKETKNVGKKK